MAAPRNDEERERLYKAAIKLFMAHGYAKTTYSDIARECGTSKSMVQHYFPKKDLFISSFFESHLEHIAHESEGGTAEDPLKTFCLMGLRHFDLLLNNEQAQPLVADILASRELTDTIVRAERNWAKQRFEPLAETVISVEDALTAALGGAYELIYQARKDGIALSPLYVEKVGIVPFALMMGFTQERISQTLKECADELGVE